MITERTTGKNSPRATARGHEKPQRGFLMVWRPLGGFVVEPVVEKLLLVNRESNLGGLGGKYWGVGGRA